MGEARLGPLKGCGQGRKCLLNNEKSLCIRPEQSPLPCSVTAFESLCEHCDESSFLKLRIKNTLHQLHKQERL